MLPFLTTEETCSRLRRRSFLKTDSLGATGFGFTTSSTSLRDASLESRLALGRGFELAVARSLPPLPTGVRFNNWGPHPSRAIFILFPLSGLEAVLIGLSCLYFSF